MVMQLSETSRFIISFAILLVTITGCVSGPRSGMSPGDAAPPFTLLNLKGESVSLSDFSGKVILINFWASWCAPCVSELPAMERLYQRLKDQGFVIVAIGIDDEEASLREFQQRFGLTFPILYDNTSRTKRNYGVSGVPESFIIGRNGRLVMIADIDDNKPVVRIVGPRLWDSPTAISRISKLLEEAK